MILDIYWWFIRLLHFILHPSLMIIDDSIPNIDKYRGKVCLFKGIKAVYLGANTYIKV